MKKYLILVISLIAITTQCVFADEYSDLVKYRLKNAENIKTISSNLANLYKSQFNDEKMSPIIDEFFSSDEFYGFLSDYFADYFRTYISLEELKSLYNLDNDAKYKAITQKIKYVANDSIYSGKIAQKYFSNMDNDLIQVMDTTAKMPMFAPICSKTYRNAFNQASSFLTIKTTLSDYFNGIIEEQFAEMSPTVKKRLSMYFMRMVENIVIEYMMDKVSEEELLYVAEITPQEANQHASQATLLLVLELQQNATQFVEKLNGVMLKWIEKNYPDVQ